MRNRGLLFAHPRDCPVRVNLVILSTLWARLLDPSQQIEAFTIAPRPSSLKQPLRCWAEHRGQAIVGEVNTGDRGGTS